MLSRTVFALVVVALVSGLALPTRADEGAPGEPPPTVAVVTGDDVNLRVGPRVDDLEVARLEKGTVLLIVERSGEWLGVRVPGGFPAAVAAALTSAVSEDDVKIVGEHVNLRVHPPKGDVAFPAFRDHPDRGAVLPLLSREGDWLWVEAPESIRAYINSKFVSEVGTLAAEGDRVSAARAARTTRRQALTEARAKAKAAVDEAAVRDELGSIGQALVKLRAAGGYDKAPVVALADHLSSTLDAHPGALDRTKALAKAVGEDLDREIERRVAFHDEVVSNLRTGTPPPGAPPPPAEKRDAVEASGTVRWEAAPGWEGGGAFVLWATDKPIYALRFAGGDLKASDGKAVKVKGRATGSRLLGLPALDVETLTPGP